MLFAQNESINVEVTNDNSNNPLGNQDVSQTQNNVEQQTAVQNDHNPILNNVPQNYNPNQVNLPPGGGNIVQQQVQQVPRGSNPSAVNRSRSTSSSYGGGSVSMGSGKKHKKGFVKTIGNKIEKFMYKNKGKKKYHPRRHKRNKRNIVRCFG